MSMTAKEFKNRLKGIVPVQLCPYTKEGELDTEGIRENTRFVVDFAKDGDKDVVLITNGSTTECYANSIEEQKKIIKTTVDTVAGRIPVVAGVSQPAAKLTIEMAKYAEEVGADCAMVILPYYHTPTREGMYKFYKAIAESVNIGIMVYNNPDVGGALIPPDLMLELSKIDNIVANKDNATTAMDYALKALMIDPRDMVLINGKAEFHYVASAAFGYRYKGFVSSVANFAPSLSYELHEAVENHDLERAYEVLKKFLPMALFLQKVNRERGNVSIIPECQRTNTMYLAVQKTALEFVGLHGGPVRLPMVDINDEEKQELKEVLQQMGVI